MSEFVRGQIPIKELISFTCQGCITVYFFKASAYITSSSDILMSSAPRNFAMNISKLLQYCINLFRGIFKLIRLQL